MSLADAIIHQEMDTVRAIIQSGEEDINDIDQYGMTPLIECAIVQSMPLAKIILANRADPNKPDIASRTALHWAVDNNQLDMVKLLLDSGADPNAFTRGSQPILVYPLLRKHNTIKKLLYKYGADLTFAQDFINTKLIGHRFQLKGDVDIVTSKKEFIELDYEGFFLEFTLEVIAHSLYEFVRNFAAREMRSYFQPFNRIIEALATACELNKYQQQDVFAAARYDIRINELLTSELLILPVAYAGHAVTFVKYGPLLAKCDRGEHSLKHGSVNIYYIGDQDALNNDFLKHILYKKLTEKFVHKKINQLLKLQPIAQLPLSSQIAGNCSWANVEAAVPTAYLLMQFVQNPPQSDNDLKQLIDDAMYVHNTWVEWDQDRALHECIETIKSIKDKNRAGMPEQVGLARKASKIAILGAVLFQTCDYGDIKGMQRAERILEILTMPEYQYILRSYIEIYCGRKLTKRGNNLLHLLEDVGVNPRAGSFPLPQRPIDE